MRSIKKLVSRALLYLFIILLLPYLYFLSQAKQTVDTFLALHPVDGEFQYQWFWVDLGGKISLQNVEFFQDSKDPVFTAGSIELIPTSLFDLLNIEEHLIYNEFPSKVVVKVVNGETKQAEKLFTLFNVNYQTEYLNYFYPEKCLSTLNKELPFINFNLNTEFVIHRTSDDSLISFDFRSKEFAKISGSFKLNNFSEQGEGGNFVSDLSLQFTDVLWLQQNTQKCLHALDLEKPEFSKLYTQFLNDTAKQNSLLLSSEAAKSYVDFIFVPQKIELAFDLQEGKTFSQIPFLPVYEYQHLVGLSIELNDSPLAAIFQAYDYISPDEPQQTEKSPGTQPKIEQPVSQVIAKNRRSLRPYIGSKIEILLYNKKKVVGYIEEVNYQSLKIYQLEHKGKTVLPFFYNDIKTITLLHAEN